MHNVERHYNQGDLKQTILLALERAIGIVDSHHSMCHTGFVADETKYLGGTTVIRRPILDSRYEFRCSSSR